MNKEQKNDALEYVNRINGSFAKMGRLGSTALILSAIVSLASVVMAMLFVMKQSEYVYVVKQNAIYGADIADRSQYRDKEVYYHVQRFHDKFYNLAPNMETINENINEAMGMADQSVLMMDNRRREQQFYSNLVNLLAVEEIKMDSLKVDVSAYPYRAEYYGRLYVIRNTSMSEYSFQSSCKLINVPPSSSNISGLRIEQFTEKKRELLRSGVRK